MGGGAADDEPSDDFAFASAIIPVITFSNRSSFILPSGVCCIVPAANFLNVSSPSGAPLALSNASKFSAGQPVCILVAFEKVTCDEGVIVVRVTDKGRGMTADQVTKVTSA